MSIIHDALKKTEDAIQPSEDKSMKQAPADTSSSPPSPSPEVAAYLKKKNKSNRIKWAFFYILAAALGLYIGNIPFDLAGKARDVIKDFSFTWPLLKKQTKAQLPQKGAILKDIPPTPAKSKESEDLVLTGTFTSGEDTYALINNHIAKVGDTINGAVVREVGEEEVTLESKGRLFTLSTR